MTKIQFTMLGASALILAAIAASIAFLTVSTQADSRSPEIPTWPRLSMTYETNGYSHTVGKTAQTTREVRRLDYTSLTEWTATVIEATTVDYPEGPISTVGDYTKLDGSAYTEVSRLFPNRQEEIPENNIRRPKGIMMPFPIEESGYQFTRTTTQARVCFQDECQDNAPGLLLVKDSGARIVFVDDARGIPLSVNDALIVREVLIDDKQQPVTLSQDDDQNEDAEDKEEKEEGSSTR